MRPVFIIGPPRSGTTLLSELLALHPQVSAHSVDFHRFHHNLLLFRDRQESEDHYYLTAGDATPEIAADYQAAIQEVLARRPGCCFMLKISTLSMQIDYVRALCPDARFVQLVRDARDAICSMEDLRQTLQSEQGQPRALGPAPDPFGLWCAERFEAKHIRAAATWFFHVTRSTVDLQFCGADNYLRLRYEDLVADPGGTLEQLLGFMELDRAAELDGQLHRVTDAPGEPDGIGFSFCQARGARRIHRFRDELGNDLRVAIAPLIETPMALLGYDADPPESSDRFERACAALEIDAAVWSARIAKETDRFAELRRVFAPENFLKQEDRPSANAKPWLVDGAVVGASQRYVTGEHKNRIAWVQKQERRHTFADPRAEWLRIVPYLDGSNSVCWLQQQFQLGEEGIDLLERLHGLGFVGYA
jgi:hypothetical protein